MKKYIKSGYLSAPEKGRHTYRVYGEYGQTFKNYKEAVRYAKWCSTLPEYDYECIIWVDDSVWYDKFSHGNLANGD